ncbi:MAG: hypothetical protein ACYSUT_07395 [Planctomycetota bacterium]|jgi:hypothetical protein
MGDQSKQKLNDRFLFIHLAVIGIWSLTLIPFFAIFIKVLENTDIEVFAQHENGWHVWSHFGLFIGLPFLCLFIWYGVTQYVMAFVLIYQAKKMKDYLTHEEIKQYLRSKKNNGLFFVNRFKRKQISKIFNIAE